MLPIAIPALLLRSVANDQLPPSSGALELLRAYHISVGGTPQPASKSSAKKATTSAAKGKGKRAASLEDDSPAPSKKGRGRKSEAATNGNSSSDWEPPLGSWEDEITEISAIIEDEPADGAVIIKAKKNPKNLNGLVLWNNGRKTQHRMLVLRVKCPQKLLDYYESHLYVRSSPSLI